MEILQVLREAYQGQFQGRPASELVVAYAPGRVEILGNHTDYNEGLVLTAAIEQKIFFLGEGGEDDKIEIYAYDVKESFRASISDLPTITKGHWSSYLVGVLKVLQEHVSIKKGFRAVFGSQVPFAAGCSSSAALEASFLYFLKAIAGFDLPTVTLAKICQKAENEYAGVPCGLMDQWSVIHGKRNELIFFDNRTLKTQTVKVSENPFSLLIINTNIKHTLVDSLYRTRREECAEVVKACQDHGMAITHLRDLKVSDLASIKDWMPENIWKRGYHVVQENNRIMRLLEMPLEKRAKFLQHAMAASHDSSKNFFENSCAELDFIEEFCRKTDGCYGAKLSGGGFGGCVVALVDPTIIKTLTLQIQKAYSQYFKQAKPLAITVSSLGEGAGVKKSYGL